MDGGPLISGVASVASLRGAKVGVVGGKKWYGPWKATMEVTRGRGQLPTIMARVEVPSDMKQKREIDIRGLRLLENFFVHTI